jgi:hypothetical protein
MQYPLSMASSQQRSIELLGIQVGASLDGRGRITDCDGVTIASCDGGQVLWIGAAVPDAVASELAAAFEQVAPPADPGEPPPALDACERILTSAGGAVQRAGGPSYVIPPEVQLDGDVAIERSDGGGADRLRGANPGNWHPVEWDELLDGRLGPWTMVMQDGRAISICHTPGPLTARTAECGVWTAPPFRGRGYAAATASAWVALVRGAGAHAVLQHGRRQRVVAASRPAARPAPVRVDLAAPPHARRRRRGHACTSAVLAVPPLGKRVSQRPTPASTPPTADRSTAVRATAVRATAVRATAVRATAVRAATGARGSRPGRPRR